MGMMQGKVQGDTFIVLDSFALPVEGARSLVTCVCPTALTRVLTPVSGTETRVNAGNEANEYMVEVVEKAKSIGRKENLVGWYHSHPGYGCWMSGIDCSTQMLNQQYQEPWLAVIIDPVRTCSAGKVDIGAFRTYPEGYKPPQSQDGGGEYQPIPLHKIEDFGVHAEQYYTLDVSIFKSSTDAALLDNLWNTYWVHTLSSSPLTTNRGFVAGQLSDVAAKLEQAGESAASVASGGGMGAQRGVLARKGAESSLTKVARDASTAALEQAKGMVSHLVKDALFNASSASGLHASVGGDAVMQDADAVA